MKRLKKVLLLLFAICAYSQPASGQYSFGISTSSMPMRNNTATNFYEIFFSIGGEQPSVAKLWNFSFGMVNVCDAGVVDLFKLKQNAWESSVGTVWGWSPEFYTNMNALQFMGGVSLKAGILAIDAEGATIDQGEKLSGAFLAAPYVGTMLYLSPHIAMSFRFGFARLGYVSISGEEEGFIVTNERYLRLQENYKRYAPYFSFSLEI